MKTKKSPDWCENKKCHDCFVAFIIVVKAGIWMGKIPKPFASN